MRVWLAAMGSLAIVCLPPPGGSAAARLQANPAADLDVLANFFLPGPPVGDAVRKGCSAAYRTKQSRTAADLALERQLPGVQDKMVAAASAYCDAEIPGVIARLHARIKADWRAAASPADLHRLARLFAPATREAAASRFDVREGEMVSDAAKRIDRPSKEELARFEAAQIAFAKTPGGGALLNRTTAYQTRIQRELSAPQGPIAAVVKGGLAAAHRAANAYAREKGLEAPYPAE